MVRSLCELEKEKGGDGVRSMRMRASDVPTRKKRGGGVLYRDEGENREPTRVPEKRGVYCVKG
jgi:hypothetical protein